MRFPSNRSDAHSPAVLVVFLDPRHPVVSEPNGWPWRLQCYRATAGSPSAASGRPSAICCEGCRRGYAGPKAPHVPGSAMSTSSKRFRLTLFRRGYAMAGPGTCRSSVTVPDPERTVDLPKHWRLFSNVKRTYVGRTRWTGDRVSQVGGQRSACACKLDARGGRDSRVSLEKSRRRWTCP